MRTCTEYPPGRRPGRTVTLPDELAAVRAMRTFRPGVSPALPSRTRPRTGRSAPVRSAWGWVGRSTALRSTAAPPGNWPHARDGPGCSASARESHQPLAAQEHGPARPGNRNDDIVAVTLLDRDKEWAEVTGV